MQPLIALTGHAGCGKDTAAKALTFRGWTRVAFADPVRQMALAIDPWIDGTGHHGVRLSSAVAKSWDYAKSEPECRRLLQVIGTDACRSIFGEDCWIRVAERSIAAAYGPVVITDCRFDNEAAFVRERGGVVVQVERPGCGPVNGHVSDAGIDVNLIDYHLHNDGDIPQLNAGILTIVYREFAR